MASSYERGTLFTSQPRSPWFSVPAHVSGGSGSFMLLERIRMTETLRDGRFVVLGRLGRGSQGETFDALDRREQRAVAIKRFDVGGAQSWKDVELAERE